ncbi:hypothetical protein FRC18_004546 [Serendipita sp. 400]|nr:hypothetical protein FRC18_004546 [Serendipita sp. 400]
MRSLLLLAFLGGISTVQAIGTAKGFGSATTGGGSAAPATPTSKEQLITWLSDSTPRVILLTSIFDFTSYYGTTTGPICKPWSCTPNPQLAINTSGWCSSTAPTGTATWYNSGASRSLVVGSNKTLLGKGSSSGLKGIGLSIRGVSNVIIQNIVISDLNSQYVWGGDAIDIGGSTNVWIDHNYIKNVGRQMLVIHFEPSTGITISNNYFDGRATYSTGCDGHHYWVFLLPGQGDQITIAQNYIYYTAGRGPHTGGTSGNTQQVHIVNNYFNSITGHALDSDIGSVVLAEGNYFNSVKTPSVAGTAGSEFFIQSSSDVATCNAAMGRTCQANTLVGSGSVAARVDAAVMKSLKSLDGVKKYTPIATSQVPSYVLANAGVGKVN